MWRHFLVVSAAAVLIAASATLCPGQQPLPATTVQLPTFSQFTVRTTVSVPDGGTMHLGGVSRGMDGRTTRGLGPLASRGIGSSRSASGVSVSATIIDHAEIDRAILAAAERRGEPVDHATPKAKEISRSINRSDALPGSVAAIREQNAAAVDEYARELADYFAKAREAESAGKTGVAKIYYQMVARRASGQLRSEAAGRLAKLNSASNTK